MKRKIIITPAIGPQETATILIDKNGMRVEDKSKNADYERDDYFYRAFIKQCVDMDEWKESWHVSVDAAMRKGTEERKKYRAIMQEKIAQREAQIKALKDGMQILGRC